MKDINFKQLKVAFLIKSNKKRQKYSIALLLIPLILISSMIEIVIVNDNSLFPKMALNYNIEGNSKISFQIQGLIGNIRNESWEKLTNSFFDDLFNEVISYVPESLFTIFTYPKFLWEIDLVNNSSPNYESIKLVGLPNATFNKLTSEFGFLNSNLSEPNQGFYIGKKINQSLFNVTGIVEDPTATYADKHAFNILGGVTLTVASRETIESIVGKDLFNTALIGAIILPSENLLQYINSFERIAAIISCFAQWSWKLMEKGNYNAASLNKSMSELVKESGYLYTNLNFNVEYFNELVPFFHDYNHSFRNYWIGALSLIIPVFLLILFSVFLCLRISKDAFDKDIHILQHHGTSLVTVFLSILIERIFHLISIFIILAIFSLILNVFTPLKSSWIFNYLSLSGYSFFISFILIGLFYLMYGIIVGISEYYKENNIIQSNKIQLGGNISIRVFIIIALFSVISYIINIVLSLFLKDIIPLEIFQILEGISILFLENIILFVGIICIMSVIEISFLVLKNSTRSIGIRKNIHKLDLHLVSIIFISFILFITSIILPFFMKYNAKTQLDLNIPSDMVISNLSIENEDPIVNVLNNLSIKQDWTSSSVLKIRTKDFPHLYLFGIRDNFINVSSMKTYIYNDKLFPIPKFNISIDRYPILLSSNAKQLNSLLIINTTEEIAGGKYNRSDEVILEIDIVNYFDVFPFVGDISVDQNSYDYNIPYIICSISLIEFIRMNIIKDSIFDDESVLFINGNNDNLLSIQDQILEFSSDYVIILKSKNKFLYENIFHDLIITVNNFNFLIVAFYIPVMTAIISIRSERKDNEILKYYKLINFKRRSLIIGRMVTISANLIIIAIIGLTAAFLILQLMIKLFRLDFLTESMLYSQFSQLFFFILLFNIIWFLALLLGYLFNFKAIKMVHFAEE